MVAGLEAEASPIKRDTDDKMAQPKTVTVCLLIATS